MKNPHHLNGRMNAAKIMFWALAALLLSSPHFLHAEDILIGETEMIQRLTNIDPEIAATKFRVSEADGRKTRAKSAYYPSLELQVLEPIPGSFPGSLGHSRVDGVMVSPYHTGFSAGFATTFTIYDFGRTGNKVKEAEQDRQTAELEAKIARIEAVQRGLNTFYTTIKFRELGKLWEQKDKELLGLEREIVRFVRTGQKSIVDRHIIRSHVERVERERLEFGDAYSSGLKVISSLLELTDSTPELVPLAQINTENHGERIDESQSPYVQRVRSEKLAAEFGLQKAKSENLPEIRAFGSAGYIEGARVVPAQNWAAGFAASFPVFQGFRIQGEIHEAESKLHRVEKQMEAAAKRIHETNLKLEQEIGTAQEEIRLLATELRTAEAGFLTAKSRYRNFQGNLTDLRDTIVTYYQTRGHQIETKLKLAYLLKVRALTNGVL